jgi:hypothetical protein
MTVIVLAWLAASYWGFWVSVSDARDTDDAILVVVRSLLFFLLGPALFVASVTAKLLASDERHP